MTIDGPYRRNRRRPPLQLPDEVGPIFAVGVVAGFVLYALLSQFWN